MVDDSSCKRSILFSPFAPGSRRKKRHERGVYHTSLVGKNIQSPMGINAISALFKRLGAATY